LYIAAYSSTERFCFDLLLKSSLASKKTKKYRRPSSILIYNFTSQLCKYAQEWAEKLSHDGQMMHRQNCIYGENLFSIWTTESSRVVTGKEPVAAWYSEIEKYNFGQEPADSSAGNFF